MSKLRAEDLSDAALVEGFASVARDRGSAVLDCDPGRANKAFARMGAIVAVLRSRGKGSRMSLLPLLDDQDRLVRYYAAQHLLGIAPERARKILEENAKFWFDPIAADARGTLHMLDNGEYKPD